MKLLEFIYVFILSLTIGLFVSSSWESSFFSNLSKSLFDFFLPLIIPITIITGGREEANNFIVIISVIIQCFIIYLLFKYILKRINT